MVHQLTVPSSSHRDNTLMCAAAGADDVFQNKEADDIYGRDYSAPTGEDQYDKTILPKVMQVSGYASRDNEVQRSRSGWDVRPCRRTLRLEWVHNTGC
jgi:Microfibril-associated/Pre-mRNA processing